MRFHLALLGLAPILLLQGRRVRRATPRLPEAAGPRSGESGAGGARGPLRVLILGDSAAAGVGVRHQREALAGRLAQALGGERPLRWALWARTGDDLATLLAQLRARPAVVFDVAVVSIGVNDVTGRTPLPRWRSGLHELCTLLQGKFGVRQLLLTALPPMHRFPALPQPLRWVLGLRARELDRALDRVAQALPGCERLALPALEGAGAVAADGFHPGAAAYEAWALAAAAAIRRALVNAPRGRADPW
jgi:lysophospholipase L1-like esterase